MSDTILLRHRNRAGWVAATPGPVGGPLEMFLCESGRVFLRADQPYIFRLDPDCEKCVAIHAVYVEATDDS